ncbi:MAG: GSCFA domain-containing protein [Pseudorhodoplanes sp.]|uniref:GSCFA domain-containing protein n=1 Tax=Pseudorhodoplanes sp. TaxID=1934341 RepID=UPI003D0A85C7
MSSNERDRNAAYDIVPRRKSNYPRMNEEFLDLPKLIDDFILDENSLPRFESNTRFFLQGSCFAENLAAELKQSGYSCFYNAITEAINSPLANLIYLGQVKANMQDPVRKEIEKADIFVLTVGVAPSWFAKSDGKFQFGPDLRNIGNSVQRTATVAEATQALLGVFRLIYDIKPSIRIVLTLSPVPLGSTFEFSSAIVADCVSKSVLRAAIHEALNACEGQKPIYFPSFEIVRWAGGHAGNAFGDDGLPRHVAKDYVRQIIHSFLSGSKAAQAEKAG